MHAPALFCSLHWAFAPHGEGEQGVTISWGGGAKNIWVNHWSNCYIDDLRSGG
jgi:hypothetical protein